MRAFFVLPTACIKIFKMYYFRYSYFELDAGSDFTYFSSIIGISCADIRYNYNQVSARFV